MRRRRKSRTRSDGSALQPPTRAAMLVGLDFRRQEAAGAPAADRRHRVHRREYSLIERAAWAGWSYCRAAPDRERHDAVRSNPSGTDATRITLRTSRPVPISTVIASANWIATSVLSLRGVGRCRPHRSRRWRRRERVTRFSRRALIAGSIPISTAARRSAQRSSKPRASTAMSVANGNARGVWPQELQE